MRKLIYIFLFLFFSINGFSQFTPGNLTVLQADASANNTTCSVVEINTTTAAQSAITTVAINGAGTNALRFSGSATSTGYLATSNDGTLLCFTGANNINTAANVNTLNPRGIGTLNAAQNFNLATTYTGTSGNQTRGASTSDNASWYIIDQGGLYTNGTSTASPSANIRAGKFFGGTIYISSASATVIQVNTVSAISGGTLTGLPGLTNNANLQDFYLVSSGSNGAAYDVLYVLSATSNTAGTISKYSLVSGTWTANGSYTTTFGGFGIAAQMGGGGAFLYVSTGMGALTANSIIKLTDVAGYNATIAITTGNNITLYSAPTGKIAKGVAFAPIASVAPSIIPNPVNLNFPNTLTGALSAPQTITLSASNLSPASGLLTITAPNTNFQVSNDGTTWSSSTTVAYSASGASVGNFQVRFSPQASGLQSGNVSITGGILIASANVAVSGTGDNALSLTFSASTTIVLNPPYISGTINDLADPAKQTGIITDIKENGINIPSANYTLTASSTNTTVVPVANVSITTADGQATIKITPAAVGYADITLTLTKGVDTKTLVIHYAASSSASSSAGTHWHTGDSDASSAIAIDDNYMITCDDEKNLLYVFDRNQSGLAVKTFDFNQGLTNYLGLTDGSAGNWKEVDVEASAVSTTVTGKSYWLGSMSNSSSFNVKPNRDRLFAITTTGTGVATTFVNAGYYAGLRQQLITWGDNNGYNFTASAADGHDPKLIDGFNVEGMVFGPDNTSLFIGFRAPLVPTANRTKAVIAPLQNFESWFNNGAPAGNPTIGAPIELDLGGRGIRDIIRLSNGFYILVAGSYDETAVPAVYRWTGISADAPVLLSSFDVTGLNLEGVLQVNEGGVLSLNKLQFISDNGDKVYYGDGIAAKDLVQNNFKKFSSDIIVSSITGVLPVSFEYFSASRQDKNVLLQWKTGQADNLRSFEILRSVNGRDFISVGNIIGASSQSVYSFTDKNIISEKLYYRIKAIEINSTQYLSDIKLVTLRNTNNIISVYPNPVKNNQFTVSANVPGNKMIHVYFANGNLFTELQFTDNKKDINTSRWAKGFYIIRIVSSEGESTSQKLIVQ
ncbi:T9SS type A sorting domain-containing protein [Ferruginibacter sp. SUN106]|uniref:T9SS type A sorting domain-containing protein n=1 Tax=Ferruginibacter sp. SUN106 TaxID=2978348 RepID=UPI003D369D15